VGFDSLTERIRESRLPDPSVRKKAREMAGVSIREMAEALSVSPMTLLRWEKGKEPRRRSQAIAYRQLLDELQKAVSI